MREKCKRHCAEIYAALVGLFFIFILPIKISYSLIPILLALAGLYFLFLRVKQKSLRIAPEYRWLVASFVIYFLLFLISMALNHGKGRELDLPSRAVLVLPILLALLSVQINSKWVMMSLMGAANLIGLVALVQVFGLHFERPFPAQMHIQAGGIAMSLALFSLCLFFYFFAQHRRLLMWFALLGFFFALFTSILSTARGAWAALPVGVIAVLWLNRYQLSRKGFIGIMALILVCGFLTYPVIEKRIAQAKYDVAVYVDKNNSNTSVGTRFELWESAWLGIQEKPLFGWGIQGIRDMHESHVKQAFVQKEVMEFDHAHNQYLQDASVRGILGFLSLLSIFFVPLGMFWRAIKQHTPQSPSYLFACLGVVHILAMMIYCLSQSFFAHNSGVIFYFFCVVVFLALQKRNQNEPLAGAK